MPRTVAEPPLPDASPRGWDLQAWEAGREVLCPLPGQLPQEGGTPRPSRGRCLGNGQNQGRGQQSGNFGRPWVHHLLSRGNHRSRPGTQQQGHAGQGVGCPTVLVFLGVRGVPGTFSFKAEMNWSEGGEREGGMWAGQVCGAAQRSQTGRGRCLLPSRGSCLWVLLEWRDCVVTTLHPQTQPHNSLMQIKRSLTLSPFP